MLSKHVPLVFILIGYLILALTFSVIIPLGEAPDEPAHLAYAQFIAKHQRLPSTLAERQSAQYRSTWPPLYHILIAVPLALIGDAPPTRLKAVGDTPRRLIPTNGQTLASFIHTTDEAWPWRGLPLAWHLGRFISIALTFSAIILTYMIALRLTQRHEIATLAAAIHAFIPQMLFIGSVLNDDNLLIPLTSLTLLKLIDFQKSARRGRDCLILGGLLGLAITAKYNALPLWVIVIGTVISQNRRRFAMVWRSILILLMGALLTGGWWFAFCGFHFNQIDQHGWLKGSLVALSAGTSDASLRQLGNTPQFSYPTLTDGYKWSGLLLQSFWGLFGGGGTIELPSWVYVGLAIFTVSSLASLSLSPYPLRFTPFFFLPLPMLRFMLSGNFIETAQGRHLFPSISIIALAFAMQILKPYRFLKTYIAMQILKPYRFLKTYKVFGNAVIFALLSLNGYTMWLIQASYPPAIPLQTTARWPVAYPMPTKLTQAMHLVGYDLAPLVHGTLPVTLIWQAKAPAPTDYLIELTLHTPDGTMIGNWLGQPIGGRYPTRAWDKGDFLRDTIPVPLKPSLSAITAALTLRLLDQTRQPVASLLLTRSLAIPPIDNRPMSPYQLRADGLPEAAPFSYRSTLSFRSTQSEPPQLVAPNGQLYAPMQWPVAIANFIVEADWPSGAYHLQNSAEIVQIVQRPRQFARPAISPENYLAANFLNTITLLGYDLPQRRVKAGQSFPLTLYWRAESPIGENLTVFNHLLDSQTMQRGGADHIPQNHYTTLLWVPKEIVSDSVNVPVQATAPNGIYWLHVGLYPANQPTKSLPLTKDGQMIDQTSVRLGPIKVGGPPVEVTVAQVTPEHRINKIFGQELTLLGYDTPTANRLILYWQAKTIPRTDYQVFVHILNESGTVLAQADGAPAQGAYPTSLWDMGEIIVDPRELPLVVSKGQVIKVGLYRLDTGARLTVAGGSEDAVELK